MKIIDEKGMVFGRVNIIDFIILSLLIFIIPVAYLGNKIFLQKLKNKSGSAVEYVEIDMPFNFIKVKPEILRLIKVGDIEVDIENRKIGEITWVGESRPYVHYFVYNPDAKLTISKVDEKLKEVPVRLKLKAELKDQDNFLYYNYDKITYNSKIKFQTFKYNVLAQMALPEEELNKKEKWLEAKVKFSGLFLELGKIINKGNFEKDSKGRIVAKLKEVVSNKPSEAQVLKLEENKFVVVTDPYRNDVTALFDLLCTEREGEYYFKDQPVKIGSTINFSSELYVVNGLLIGLNKE